MADFILVHGAWGGGHQFNRLADNLRGAGHRVLIAQLTGLGARAHLASPSINLETHIDDVVQQIDSADLSGFILVGHSYGGMVIAGVASRLGGRIARIVYLDAFLPQDGQSLWDVVGPFERNHYIAGQRDTPGLVAPLPGIDAPGLSRHPLLTLIQPVRLSGKETAIAQRCYVFASGWDHSPFAQFHDRVKDDASWQVHVLDCGHFIMAERPDELVAILTSGL
ncbi:alpha/beta fold hydrolase [Novosphingobium sp.]|uniref:alpha/beta fold hydrolase n=1 Tax=Novosphingobium sp. TaxID=1874826 RepID=UPI0025D9E476|nr:alpha/beta hydrolase family protein [Novosphingobium sp.]